MSKSISYYENQFYVGLFRNGSVIRKESINEISILNPIVILKSRIFSKSDPTSHGNFHYIYDLIPINENDEILNFTLEGFTIAEIRLYDNTASQPMTFLGIEIKILDKVGNMEDFRFPNSDYKNYGFPEMILMVKKISKYGDLVTFSLTNQVEKLQMKNEKLVNEIKVLKNEINDLKLTISNG